MPADGQQRDRGRRPGHQHDDHRLVQPLQHPAGRGRPGAAVVERAGAEQPARARRRRPRRPSVSTGPRAATTSSTPATRQTWEKTRCSQPRQVGRDVVAVPLRVVEQRRWRRDRRGGHAGLLEVRPGTRATRSVCPTTDLRSGPGHGSTTTSSPRRTARRTRSGSTRPTQRIERGVARGRAVVAQETARAADHLAAAHVVPRLVPRADQAAVGVHAALDRSASWCRQRRETANSSPFDVPTAEEPTCRTVPGVSSDAGMPGRSAGVMRGPLPGDHQVQPRTARCGRLDGDERDLGPRGRHLSPAAAAVAGGDRRPGAGAGRPARPLAGHPATR